MLLVLQRSLDHYSDATAIAGQLGLRREDVASALEMLARQNLLDVRLGEAIRYRFGRLPGSAKRSASWANCGAINDGLVVLEVTAKQRALEDFSRRSGFEEARTSVAEAVYLLCTLSNAACAILLFRRYGEAPAQSRGLLLWSSVGFSGLALANTVLFVDLVLVPSMDLSLIRASVNAISTAVLVIGLMWELE